MAKEDTQSQPHIFVYCYLLNTLAYSYLDDLHPTHDSFIHRNMAA
ncbi:MAG: hypothetical protein Q4F26_05280 [Atopococcus tabaci]|uniref:Uncharacterized protein n=1 Tax=Atopococcus tabaci TaxID=269774 RepID=A0AA43ZT89_9LACT|nr:hypothetical protein [Atopococcus tabaci]